MLFIWKNDARDIEGRGSLFHIPDGGVGRSISFSSRQLKTVPKKLSVTEE
jgi:hypothetical protein